MTPSLVAIRTDGRVTCSAIPFRFRGRLQLSVVVKAAFSIAPDATAAHAGPAPLAAADRAPYLARCDVLFKGHAYAPRGSADASAVRLGLWRDRRALLEKTIHVFGDRGPNGARSAFACLPIVYERAAGGAGKPNPIGTDTPNFVDPIDARRAAGFGPIAPTWPDRRALLGAIDPALFDRPIAEVPDAMPWDYFQAAPRDQQIEPLRGGEWLVLDGLHPTLPRAQTRIPAARGAVRIGAAAGQVVPLLCDTLAIDGDAQVFSLSWRGQYEVSGGEASLASLLVAAALETPGTNIDWAPLLTPVKSAKASAPAKETMVLRIDDLNGIPPQAVLPFDGRASTASPSPPPSSTVVPIPGAPWSRREPAAPLRPPEMVELDTAEAPPLAAEPRLPEPPAMLPPPPDTHVANREVANTQSVVDTPARPPLDPWAPPPPPPEPAPLPSPPPQAFDRPAAAAVKGSLYAKFSKK